MNVFTAVLSGLKGLNEAKTGFGQEDVKKSATNLIIVRQHCRYMKRGFILSIDYEIIQRTLYNVLEYTSQWQSYFTMGGGRGSRQNGSSDLRSQIHR